MKHTTPSALTVTLAILLLAGAGSVEARQNTAHLAASPLMKAMQSTAQYRSAEKITQYEDELNWINETRTRNEYYQGRLVVRHEDVWEGSVFGDWVPFMRYEYTYQPDGTLATETIFEWDAVEWRSFERTLYEGTAGLFSRILVQAPNGAGGWSDVQQTTFEIQNDLIVAGQTDYWLGEWTPDERFAYVDDPAGVIETTQRPNGSTWMDTERTIYPGLSLYYLHQELAYVLDRLAELEGMMYAIRLPEMIAQNWDGAAWVNEMRIDRTTTIQAGTFYPIDETTVTEEWDGTEWVPTGRTVVTFSLDHEFSGLPASLSMQLLEGSEWVEFGTERYILQAGVRKIAQSTLSMNLGTGMREVSRVRLEWVDAGSVDVENPETPHTFSLSQNVPNPFNPSTRIGYTLTSSQHVQLAVYDMLGRRVEVLDSGFRPAGAYDITWDASDMPSGMYLYRLETAGQVATKSMVLLK